MPYDVLEGIDNISVESLRMVWNSSNQDPIKATILRAVLPYIRNHGFTFELCQVVFLRFLSMEERNSLLKCFQGGDKIECVWILGELAEHPEIWGSPISDVQQEGTSSSSDALAGRATVRPGGV